jgi:hypothetical protein
MKKILFAVLAAAMLACVPGVALADAQIQDARIQADTYEEMIISPMYTYIFSASCNLSISSNGVASMSASIDCAATINKIRMAQYLQRYEGGSWNTISSWSQYYYSDEASWSNTYNVTSGYNYRLYVYYYAYNGNTLLETVTRFKTASY